MKPIIRLEINHRLYTLFDLPTEGLKEKSIKLKEIWKNNEKKIVKGLEKVTGLEFSRNYIDVFLVNRENIKNSISHPLILGVGEDSNKNFCILIHELIHNLMWDNVQKDDWSVKIQKLFPYENKKTAIHVAVHAVFEAIYTDFLKNPEEIIKDIERSQKFPDYQKAWEIVKQEGYKNIIDKLKK